MERKLQIAVALALSFAVAVLLVLPAYDVMPTAMRAWRAAQMLALAMAAQVVFFSLSPAVRVWLLVNVLNPLSAPPDILDLTCSRVC